MKMEKMALWLFSVALSTGCSAAAEPFLVNTLEFDLEGLGSLSLDYDAEDVILLRSASGRIVLREYMTEDDRHYYADTRLRGGDLLISEGRRPWNAGFKSYVELYVPDDLPISLRIHSTSGKIRSSFSLDCAGAFQAETTSGALLLEQITAQSIRLSSTSGKVEVRALAASKIEAVSTSGSVTFTDCRADEFAIANTSGDTTLRGTEGLIAYQGKGGNLRVERAFGAAQILCTGDGSVQADFARVSGDIGIAVKNGELKLSLPRGLDFWFNAISRQGLFDISFANQLQSFGEGFSGTVGLNPQITVNLESRNGEIIVVTK